MSNVIITSNSLSVRSQYTAIHLPIHLVATSNFSNKNNHTVKNYHTTHTSVAEQLFGRNDINSRDSSGVQTCQKESSCNIQYYKKMRASNARTLLSNVFLSVVHITGFLDLEDTVAL